MRAIKVATEDPNAYYRIVSRLKRTHLQFSSAVGELPTGRDLVITSRNETPKFEGLVVAIEDLDEDPLVMEGQLLSRLVDRSRRNLLVGIDPGSRIGLAVFYGGIEFGALTTGSAEGLVSMVVRVASRVPHSAFSVKIGGGEPRSSLRLARMLRRRLPEDSLIEIVDESGTSRGRSGAMGAARDQRAAARIAYRKGVRFI